MSDSQYVSRAASVPRALLVALLVLSGCLEERGAPDAAVEPCSACHGDPSREGDFKAAPPRNLDGDSAIDAVGVGAHQIHLDPAGRAAPVACETCHIVPNELYAPGHVDTAPPAEVVFGADALRGDHQASYTQGTCSATYCHGASEPEWLAPRSPAEACGTCHGLPPAPPHPLGDDCSACHGNVMGPNGEFRAPELHVNGSVEVARDCNTCHGTGVFGAPPPDLLGNNDVSSRGVGAHGAHLVASYSHAAVDCTECHVVPGDVDDEGHWGDDGRAEVVFGALARAKDTNPSYDADAGTCATYCHGEHAPNWLDPRDSAEACGSCHGLPPQAPHPQSERCGECHGAVLDLAGGFRAPERHVDGVVDLGELECNSCHGSGDQGAPAPDLAGSSDPSQPGVGAHAIHLVGSATHAPVQCDECHQVPDDYGGVGHDDTDTPAEVIFGVLATSGDSTPRYDATSHTCAGSYCHLEATPNWIEPLPNDEVCGSCHAIPPPLPHPPRDDCSSCHDAVMGANEAISVPGLHVNGVVEVDVDCASCHGSGDQGGPPPNLALSSSRSEVGVGAHAVHLGGGDFRPVACEDCHLVPEDIDAEGHIDDWDRAEVRFAGVATVGPAAPIWDPAAHTCANTWCHGVSDTSPSWVVEQTLACDACHGFPPSPPHPAVADCFLCHLTVDSALQFSEPNRHVDGVVDVVRDCGACHGSGDDGAPPPDLLGNLDPSARGVGAHSAHLAPRALFRPVACGECHVVPTDVADPNHLDDWGAAEVVFSGVADTEASGPSWDASAQTCADTWCHAPRGALGTALTWTTETSLGCDQCHGAPPPSPHPPSFACSECHSSIDVTLRFPDPTRHVDGIVDLN